MGKFMTMHGGLEESIEIHILTLEEGYFVGLLGSDGEPDWEYGEIHRGVSKDTVVAILAYDTAKKVYDKKRAEDVMRTGMFRTQDIKTAMNAIKKKKGGV